MGEGSKASSWITLVIVMIIGIILVPIVVDAVANTNMTEEFWNFTGGAGARTLFLLLPFVFVVGLVIFFIVRLIKG
jgi:peptidoglycan biosynthesis protein MviN/MurJ (putative lipid II flippase)